MAYILARKTAGELCCAAASAASLLFGKDSSHLFGPSVKRGPDDRPVISLTFDDGPSEGTEQVLKILRQFNVPATFFLCGQNVRRLPALSREIAAAGHELGNHTDTHIDLWFRSKSVLRDELAKTQAAICEATGILPRLFRPTYGSRWLGLRQVLDELKLARIMWDTGGDDWSHSGLTAATNICAQVSNGSIICLHDGRSILVRPNIQPTLDALSILVPELLAKSYKFQTLSDLLKPR